MKHKPVYEQIISHKLEQVPLPKLQEEIWLRIECQLDNDMPADETGAEPPDIPPAPGWTNLVYKAGPLAVIAAMIIIFTSNKNHAAKNSVANNDSSLLPAMRIMPLSMPQQNVVAKEEKSMLLTTAQHTSARYPMNLKISTPKPIPDSLISVTPQIIAPHVELEQQPVADAALGVQVANDTMPQKKARGVKGITDADYRIVVVKDSTRKHN